jgi:peroxiredoxin
MTQHVRDKGVDAAARLSTNDFVISAWGKSRDDVDMLADGNG